MKVVNNREWNCSIFMLRGQSTPTIGNLTQPHRYVVRKQLEMSLRRRVMMEGISTGVRLKGLQSGVSRDERRESGSMSLPKYRHIHDMFGSGVL